MGGEGVLVGFMFESWLVGEPSREGSRDVVVGRGWTGGR